MSAHPGSVSPRLARLIASTRSAIVDAVAAHPKACFATSLGAEDMVLLDLLETLDVAVDAFTLDTGRLHEETYSLLAQAASRYRRPIRVMFPQATDVEHFVAVHGINAFRDSIELRKQCCQIRKMEPLSRALAGHDLWITGLRREQSVTRSAIELLARDESNGLYKLNPLIDWTASDVSEYVAAHGVPVNELHGQGFPSIGCSPCTRAIAPGEHERAGRWWWEQPESRECGLHVTPDGRLVRTLRAQVA